ncbi:MAG: TlpA family protein disulfide reductase [Planctomycetota bacterium]
MTCWGKSAESAIEGDFKLRVGTKVPEITGSDCDGTLFSLDDYSGHVRVVIFTGNWCPPCKAMYPQLTDLQTKDKGVTILGVSTDKELSTLKQAIENKEITWRCWWGKGFGSILNGFGITRFPTVLVPDRSGTLRFKGLRDESLVKAFELLCTETSDETPP